MGSDLSRDKELGSEGATIGGSVDEEVEGRELVPVIQSWVERGGRHGTLGGALYT